KTNHREIRVRVFCINPKLFLNKDSWLTQEKLYLYSSVFVFIPHPTETAIVFLRNQNYTNSD
ncbi:hypothetical protein CEN49_09025, partial [Fischerella thermalis CCMEE 5273]